MSQAASKRRAIAVAPPIIAPAITPGETCGPDWIVSLAADADADDAGMATDAVGADGDIGPPGTGL